ncbi:MAG: FAD-dependent monooxygenase [Aggregatilineales bacterium]
MKHPVVGSRSLTQQRALVIGAGLAGLLAARVLLDHFASVAVVGRCRSSDNRPPGHVLAVGAFRALERLFPGISAELALIGAPSVDWAADCPALLPAGWAPRFPSGLLTRAVSGDGLAQTVRRRLTEYGGDRLELRDNARAVGLLWQDGRVTGARLLVNTLADTADADDDSPTLVAISADFVVFAGGQSSQLADWLAQVGCPAPAQTVISAPQTYSVGLFRRPAGADPAWRALLIVPVAGRPGALLHPLEGQRWAVTLAPPAGAPSPADLDGLLTLVRDLPTPSVYDALRAAEPLESVRVWAHAGSRVAAYHRTGNWPDSLAIIGDAVCALNPAYGHSLTAAALAAVAFAAALSEQRRAFPNGALDGLGLRAQRAQAAALRTPMRTAAAVEAWRADSLGVAAARCGTALLAAAADRPSAHRALLEVVTLTRPPAALLRPAVALQALRGAPPLASPSPIPPAPDLSAIRSTQELTILS